MWLRRTVLCVAMLGVAVFVQLAFLGRLGLPGAVPDLVLVTVVALALAYGPVVGAVCGFGAGLVLDFAPPSVGVVGIGALIGMAVGLIAGATIDPRDRTVPLLMALAGGSTGGAVLVEAGLTAVLGGDRVDWSAVPALALTAGIYGVLLSMAVVPVVAWLVRRLTPEAVL